MYRLLFVSLLIFIFLPTTSFAQSKDEMAVRHLLHEQTIAWNAGDVDGFMKGYWQNDSLLFIGKNGPKYGYQTTLDNYKTSYPDAATMGKLRFTLLHVNRLSPGYFFVTGQWHLTRKMGDVQGHFTLLVKKFGDRWFIVSDHSS